MKDNYDVLIVGAGPAGMFAANGVAGRGLSVLMVDMGKEVKKAIKHHL